MNETYIDISKASSSSLVERVGASSTLNSFVSIKRIAEIKGLKSTRSIRIAIQKGKYIAREVKFNGGTSYEILYSSLEPEIQERIVGRGLKHQHTRLVPPNQKIISEYQTGTLKECKHTNK